MSAGEMFFPAEPLMGRKAEALAIPSSRPGSPPPKEDGAPAAPWSAPIMKKRSVSIVACLVVVAISALPVRASDLAAGQRFAVAISGLPDELYNCQPVSMTVGIELYDDGTARRKPVVVTTWIETPFGRAVLNEQVRSVLPGQTVEHSVAYSSQCGPGPGSGAAARIVIGVTASIKGETLEVRHVLLYHDALPRS